MDAIWAHSVGFHSFKVPQASDCNGESAGVTRWSRRHQHACSLTPFPRRRFRASCYVHVLHSMVVTDRAIAQIFERRGAVFSTVPATGLTKLIATAVWSEVFAFWLPIFSAPRNVIFGRFSPLRACWI